MKQYMLHEGKNVSWTGANGFDAWGSLLHG
jgi:hypothetical protein